MLHPGSIQLVWRCQAELIVLLSCTHIHLLGQYGATQEVSRKGDNRSHRLTLQLGLNEQRFKQPLTSGQFDPMERVLISELRRTIAKTLFHRQSIPLRVLSRSRVFAHCSFSQGYR